MIMAVTMVMMVVIVVMIVIVIVVIVCHAQESFVSGATPSDTSQCS